MAMLDSDITYSGSNRQGLDNNGVLINMDDLSTKTVNSTTAEALLDDLTLKSGKSGFSVKIPNMSWNVRDELVINPEGDNKYRHFVDNIVIDASVLENLEQAHAMSENVISRYILICRNVKKTKYFVVGIEYGMVIQSNTRSLKEGNGNRILSIASQEGLEEPSQIRELLETDLTATETAFNAKFVAA